MVTDAVCGPRPPYVLCSCGGSTRRLWDLSGLPSARRGRRPGGVYGAGVEGRGRGHGVDSVMRAVIPAMSLPQPFGLCRRATRQR